MKLLKITNHYPRYIKDFYLNNVGLSEKSYLDQKKALDYDAFGWADFWSYALTPLGYEMMEVTTNAEPLQRAWARENSLRGHRDIDPREIVLEQVKKFHPDILWLEDCDKELLKRIRAEVSSVRVVLASVGSAVPPGVIWREVDLVLSCALETVESMRKAGVRSEQLHHGFDPRINLRLEERPKHIDFSFVGQILRGSQFHSYRERLLELLASRTRIEIFSPGPDSLWKAYANACFMIGAHEAVRVMKSIGFPDSVLKSLPVIGKVNEWTPRPALPINHNLKRYLKPPVYGLKMFQVLRDSRIALNIHADSSPRFASNMRLFETTGVGTCMMTDWRENLPHLFVPGKEVVAYRSAEECVEQAKWLLDHPKEREEIAGAGQARTIREHSYEQRALRFDEIVKREIHRKH